MTVIRRVVRALFLVVIASLGFATGNAGAQNEKPSLALIDCTLIDDNAAYNDADTNRIQSQRLAMIGSALRDDMRERGLFRIADNAPAKNLIASLQGAQDMSACNGCELRVARQLGVERVGICWVQKISNLILNMNLRVEDAKSGATLFQRSVDIRGNTDLSWQRGAKALVVLLADDPSMKP
ncbi:DUF3280 domain-containing protein [Caballeronia sp. GAWG1-1]|uniref:DUF3280 domain-containing protein n=1 Tax=Caballeronia sp. GAWG1-1 TaxID=2921742 RepID=UPI00202871F8|nr:DUF3280 domain-containing protein [Caballeronia sp. GAWG1-1]